MLSRLFGSDRTLIAIASDLYGMIVARARSPSLYADLGVPDTVAGRFEMVVLHMVVILHRLHGGTGRERDIGQHLFEIFCENMDETLREFGVSDVVMGKRMNGMTQGFFGRQEAYGAALQAGSRDDLASALARNLHPDRDNPANVALADYGMAFAIEVAAIGAGEFEAGKSGLARPGEGPLS